MMGKYYMLVRNMVRLGVHSDAGVSGSDSSACLFSKL